MRCAIRLLLAAAALLVCAGCARAADVTIYRDRYGTPSLEAARLEDALYGLGYTMATDGAVKAIVTDGINNDVVFKVTLDPSTTLHIPEPTTLACFGLAAAGLALRRRKGL